MHISKPCDLKEEQKTEKLVLNLSQFYIQNASERQRSGKTTKPETLQKL